MGDLPSAMKEQETVAKNVDGETWSVQSALREKGIDPSTIKSTADPIQFLHILERLKTTKRQGWIDYGISGGESIGDHMYRMSIITMLCPKTLMKKLNIDIPRCTKMALTHDMAESLVGDLTPNQKDAIEKTCGKGEKSRREGAVMRYFGEVMLGKFEGGDAGDQAGDTGKDLIGAWQEYEDSKTNNSMFVHDVDKIELLLQMVEYERSSKGSVNLHEFTEVAERLQLQEMKGWWTELQAEREQMWKDF